MINSRLHLKVFLILLFSIVSMSQTQNLTGLPNKYDLNDLTLSSVKLLFEASDLHDNYDGYDNFFSWKPNHLNKTVLDYLCEDNYAHTKLDTTIYYGFNKAVVVLATVEFHHFESGLNGHSGCHACLPKYNFIVFEYFNDSWSPLLYGDEWIREGAWGKGPEFGFEVINIGHDKYALKSDDHDGNQGYNIRRVRLFLLESGIPEIFQFDKEDEFWCFLDELDENNEEIYYSNSCSKYLSFYRNENSDYYNIRIGISNNDEPCKGLRDSFDCDDNIRFYGFSKKERKYVLLDTFNVVYQNNLIDKIMPVIVDYKIETAKSQGYHLFFEDSFFHCKCESSEDLGKYCPNHVLDETYLYFPERKILEKDVNDDGIIDYMVNYTIEGYYGGNLYSNYNAIILGGDKMKYIEND